MWARVQGQGSWASDVSNEQRRMYWAVYRYNDLYGSATPSDPTLATGQIQPMGTVNGSNPNGDVTAPTGASYGGAQSNSWGWRELTTTSTRVDLDNNTRYVLKIWAGDVGFDIDQIVVGNKNNAGFSSNYGSGTPFAQATTGSAFRQACNRCNPIYGLKVNQADCAAPKDNGASTVLGNDIDLGDPRSNPLFADYQPIRGAKEAVKNFIRRLNPEFDQVGVVSYSTNTEGGNRNLGRVELRCRRYRSASDCFQSSSAISYTDVLNVVEKLSPNGSTNQSNGMLMGLRQLGVAPGGNIQYNVAGGFDNSCVDATDQCSRGGSARRVKEN